ncbi:MAG: hypothetical protein II849_07360 [Bacteroidales bacterium]|nr:hypothetical protein [Bacteroidales bacterium]
MKKGIKELTEGMQRLCAIANRIVAHGDEVSPIERDLLLEDLRKLYDVALCLGAEESGERRAESGDRRVAMPDDEILSSTVMATMAAMAPAPVAEAQDTPMVAEKPAPVVVEKPAPAVETQRAASPKETEDTPASGETHASLQEEKVLPAEETAAPAEESVAAEPEPAPMPAMEELESNGNSLLFDEVIIEEPAPAVEEMPAPTVETQHAASPKETEDTPAAEETNDTPAIEETAAPAESPKAAAEPEHKAAGTQASLLDYLKRPVEEKPTVRTLGESLGGAESAERRVESVLTKKVSDLRTVININDKFSFMSELFHNNMKAYNDFILRLNAIDTRDEALLCVSEVSAQYHWDESSLAVQSFYKVFDKKF